MTQNESFDPIIYLKLHDFCVIFQFFFEFLFCFTMQQSYSNVVFSCYRLFQEIMLYFGFRNTTNVLKHVVSV